MMVDTLPRRLWAKVVRTNNGCLEYAGAHNAFGYGIIRARRDDGMHTMVATHRAAWTVTHGPIPEGMHVLHRCDNPPCCNPDHLFLGTDADNMSDKCAKGRQSREFDLPQTKLSDVEVAELRHEVAELRHEYATSGLSQYALARKYGISQPHVSYIVNHKVRSAA
jgi:hypothetical protein